MTTKPTSGPTIAMFLPEGSGLPQDVPRGPERGYDYELLTADSIIVGFAYGGFGEGEANARLLAAAYTSYQKHFPADPVAAAESDLLGEALRLLNALVHDDGIRSGEKWDAARELLAHTKAIS